MCTGRVCISTKSHQPVSEKVNVEIHGETFETQVHEIGTWSINIVEESDISSTGDENEIEKDADSSDANSVDGLEDVIKNLNNSKEDEESNGGSPKVIVEDLQIAKEANTSDLSCLRGFEHLKRESTRRCSTSFAKRQNKDIKGISFIHELSQLIEVGGSLGLVVRDIRITALDRMWSDHIPILLHCNKRDFGLVPFKVYHSWFNREALKPKIRLRYATLRSKEISQNQDTMMALKTLDDKIEVGYASIEDRDSRIKLLHEIDKFDSFKAMDSIQKARIKWDVEGDENSKFFHRLINQKRKNNSINGIMHKGVWVTD
ncbi:hypothetical protein Tco_0127504 [Tanacetum coccineum]